MRNMALIGQISSFTTSKRRRRRREDRGSDNSPQRKKRMTAGEKYWYQQCFFPSNLSFSGRSHLGSLFTNEGSWRNLYFRHTYRPCLWRHWYSLLRTKLQLPRSCFRDFQTFYFLWLSLLLSDGKGPWCLSVRSPSGSSILLTGPSLKDGKSAIVRKIDPL